MTYESYQCYRYFARKGYQNERVCRHVCNQHFILQQRDKDSDTSLVLNVKTSRVSLEKKSSLQMLL